MADCDPKTGSVASSHLMPCFCNILSSGYCIQNWSEECEDQVKGRVLVFKKQPVFSTPKPKSHIAIV